jgi:hypothetical protein
MSKRPLKELLVGKGIAPMKQSQARTPAGQPLRPMTMREFEYQKPRKSSVKKGGK